MLALLCIFGVVTTQPLQECCTNCSLSSGGMLALLCIFGVIMTHPLQERCTNCNLSSGGMLALLCIFVPCEDGVLHSTEALKAREG